MVLGVASQREDGRKTGSPTHHHMKNPGTHFEELTTEGEAVGEGELHTQAYQEGVVAPAHFGVYQKLPGKVTVE